MTASQELPFKNTRLQEILLVLFLLLTTAITGEQHGDYIAGFYRALKILAYSAFLALALLRIWQVRKDIPGALKSLLRSFHPAFLAFIGMYFLGLLIGALRGPSPLSSLWQTTSDGIVFTFAFLYFGWLSKDTPGLVCSLLKILAFATPVLLLAALIPYLQNLPDLSVVIPLSGANYPLLTLPFNHPNHFAYILMVGTLAAGFQFFDGNEDDKSFRHWLWAIPTAFLLYGLYLTGGRGAILGTGVGLLGMLIHHKRWLGFAGLTLLLLGAGAVLGVMVFADPDRIAARADVIPVDNRSFDVFAGWDDERWQERVDRNGGLISFRSDRLTSADAVIAPGTYRLLIYSHAIEYRVNEKPIAGKIPAIQFTLSRNDAITAEGSLHGPRGWDYRISQPFQVTGSDPLQIELSLVQPAFEVDPRGYVSIQHILFIPETFPTWLIRIHKILPKTSLSYRPEVWIAGLQNLREYGPLGVGAGNAESLPGLGMHNMFMEQYGEGGLLGLLGFLGWLIVPILTIKRSRLDRGLAWAVAAMMAGLLIHGIFWEQFLNGLRFLTLVYVCLWTALATRAEKK